MNDEQLRDAIRGAHFTGYALAIDVFENAMKARDPADWPTVVEAMRKAHAKCEARRVLDKASAR